MSYASGIGSFGFGCQAAKGTAATSSLQFIPASRVGMVPTQIVNMTPPEIGGGLVLKEAYKAGVYVTGDAMFTVRPDDIGWLLYALCGSVDTTADSPEVGMHTHIFKMASDQSSLPWITVLKNISDVLTEQYLDCKIAGATFQITAGGAMTVSFRIVGMQHLYPELTARFMLAPHHLYQPFQRSFKCPNLSELLVSPVNFLHAYHRFDIDQRGNDPFHMADAPPVDQIL